MSLPFVMPIQVILLVNEWDFGDNPSHIGLIFKTKKDANLCLKIWEEVTTPNLATPKMVVLSIKEIW